jgi:hypothetical protein
VQELGRIMGNEKTFVLRIVQPGLAGLMDGSASTLARTFATFARRCRRSRHRNFDGIF